MDGLTVFAISFVAGFIGGWVVTAILFNRAD